MNTDGRSPPSERPHAQIYTDGGCDDNPGPGGYGVVLLHPKKRAEVSGAFRSTTNNRMEIMAATRGLEMLKQPCRVTLYSDSQYLVRAMTKGWAAAWKKRGRRRADKAQAANPDLWQRSIALCETHQVGFCWIRRHAGNRNNERCDELSRASRLQAHLPPDDGYENKADFEAGKPVAPRAKSRQYALQS